MSIKQDGSAVGLCPPAASERQEGAAYWQAAAQQPARQKSPARVLDAGPRVRKGAGRHTEDIPSSATYRGCLAAAVPWELKPATRNTRAYMSVCGTGPKVLHTLRAV